MKAPGLGRDNAGEYYDRYREGWAWESLVAEPEPVTAVRAIRSGRT